MKAILVSMWFSFVLHVLVRVRHPVRAARVCRSLATRMRHLRGGPPPRRLARVAGRYFGHPHFPGWPSAAFRRLLDTELEELGLHGRAPHRRVGLQTVILSVNRTCPLRCEHCYEWDGLRDTDTVPVADLVATVERFQDLGTSQVLLSGGEPMQRMDALLEILSHARAGVDFWVLTSGVGFTPERATRLRQAGLTGISLSLDHWDPEAHNAFRGRDATFSCVQRAAAAARRQELVLVLALCPTRAFVNEDNLRRYARRAVDLGAHFIQVFEPRAVGHYANQDVALLPEQQELLERWIESTNRDPEDRRSPAVFSQDVAARHRGCSGAGDRFLYVDTELQIHACPFCRGPAGSALESDLEETILGLRRRGCGEPVHG